MTIKLTVKMTPDAGAMGKQMGRRKYKQMADEKLGGLSKRLNKNIQEEAPKRSGKLAKAHRQHQLKQLSYEGYVDGRTKASKYYPIVIKGAGPRIIVPIKKKALYWPGARHPVKKVNWPGFKGNDYVKTAIGGSQGDIRKTQEEIGATIEQAIVS